jgi:hypothetical protein
MVGTVAGMMDMVVEDDRTTLAPGWWQRVVSVLHLVTMCLIMDTGRLHIRCKLCGKACTVHGYTLWMGHQQ